MIQGILKLIAHEWRKYIYTLRHKYFSGKIKRQTSKLLGENSSYLCFHSKLFKTIIVNNVNV